MLPVSAPGRLRGAGAAVVAALLLAALPAVSLDRDFLFQFPNLVELKPFLRWYWAWDQRAYPLDEVPEGALAAGLEQTQAAEAEQSAGALGSLLVWESLGPSPLVGGQIGRTGNTRDMAGRATEIAVHPQDPDRWLIGGAQGGIWETRDGGASWTPLTDAQASLATGSIAIAASAPETIYVGTGEAAFSADSYHGAGLLKSTDGGASWTLLATEVFANASFSDVKVDPFDASTVLAATSRGIAGRGPSPPPVRPPRGIHRSEDGGVTWTQTLNGNATDLEPDPTNFDRQFAGLGEAFGDAANGVYRSFDGGISWTLLTGPTVPWTNPPFSTLGVGRVELAIAPSDPDVLYVSIQDSFNGGPNDGGLLALWRTDDAWSAQPVFLQVPTGQTDNGTGIFAYCGWDRAFASPSRQCWYDHELLVDPLDPDTLYAGGIPLWKLDGVVWTEVSNTLLDPTAGIHVDQHAMAWAGTRLVVGNDGGVWSSPDGGATWDDHNPGLATIQYYDGSAHPASDLALGGSQDNGSHAWRGDPAWDWIFGGDGADSAISATDPDNDWAVSSQFLNISKTTNGGGSFSAADNGIDATNAPFIARFESCPANAEVMIAGTDNLWRSDDFFDGGANFTANGPEEGAAATGQLTGMAFGPSDPTCSTYAYGTRGGVLRMTTDGGASWRDLDAGGAVPNRFVTDVAFDPADAAILYVSLSGFDEGTPGQPGHLFRTADALAASPVWANASPPANLPLNSVLVNPGDRQQVYAAADFGVWASEDGGATWSHSGPAQGMPNVAVFDLQLDGTGGTLYAFTHGRGAFAAPVPLAGTPALALRLPAGTLTLAGGDGDPFLDNCEEATQGVEVENVGVLGLTAVEIVRIEPVSHPETTVTTALPLLMASSLAPGAVATGELALRASGLAFDETLEVEVEVRADSAAGPVSRVELLRVGSVESDFEIRPAHAFTFETDLEGWRVVQGTFTRSGPGAGTPPSGFALASSSLAANQCDEVVSPEVRLTATSTLSLFNQFSIEPGTEISGFYDRANVGLLDVETGQRTTVAPDGGRAYDASGPNGVCVTANQGGWAGPGIPFAESTWSAAALGAPGLAGRRLRLDVGYGTDPNLEGTGIQFDDVTLTDFELQVPDGQADVCETVCLEIDDAHPAVEYRGGWHRREDPGATHGGFHRRMGNGNGNAPSARVAFEAGAVTLLYAVSNRGGSADVYLDGAFAETLSFSDGSGAGGPEILTFGQTRTYSGLGSGSHELRLEHRSGAVYVDGFTFGCEAFGGADSEAALYHSETEVTNGSGGLDLVLEVPVAVGADDEEVSVVVEGSVMPLTVQLVAPGGELLASGGALIPGLPVSGVDAAVAAPGAYTVAVLGTAAEVEVSVARTVRNP